LSGTAKLFGYYRSSSSYRVRIALALKGRDVTHVPVNILPGIDAQKSNYYKDLNPQGRVPFWVEEGFSIAQSNAIIEYIEETPDGPALLPENPQDRAYVRQLVNIICADVQPLNNLPVLQYLKGELGADEAAVKTWYAHWVHAGFEAVETMLKTSGKMGIYCFGDTPTMADIHLIPQIFNAQRFDVSLTNYPLISAINAAAMKHPAFIKAAPENQEDAP